MMDEYLINRLKELEDENTSLKKQVEELKCNTLGWDNLKYLIVDKLKILDLQKTRPYGDFKVKITNSIGQIVRETFNYKFIRDLKAEHYDKAKEITETIINFCITNFVNDKL